MIDKDHVQFCGLPGIFCNIQRTVPALKLLKVIFSIEDAEVLDTLTILINLE